MAAARRLGCPVHVWTVNDPATARRLWARGVAGVVTNEPEVILEARESEGPAQAGPSVWGSLSGYYFLPV